MKNLGMKKKSWMALLLAALMILTTLSPAGVAKAAEADTLTVHLTNIYYINPTKPQSKENGKAVAWENTVNLSANQTKLATGFNSFVGGKNASAGAAKFSTKFQNVFVLADSESGPAFTENAAELVTVSKVQYKGNGLAVIYLSDGSM